LSTGLMMKSSFGVDIAEKQSDEANRIGPVPVLSHHQPSTKTRPSVKSGCGHHLARAVGFYVQEA
jgi:hypothetical protein